MKRLKVLTVVGALPEIICLARVLQKLDASPAIKHVLVHTGQNYDHELNEVFLEDLVLRQPDYYFNAAGSNATSTAGQILIHIDPVQEAVKPDAFLVLGDMNSCLCAIAAKNGIFPSFIWKPRIVVLINGCLPIYINSVESQRYVYVSW